MIDNLRTNSDYVIIAAAMSVDDKLLIDLFLKGHYGVI